MWVCGPERCPAAAYARASAAHPGRALGPLGGRYCGLCRMCAVGRGLCVCVYVLILRPTRYSTCSQQVPRHDLGRHLLGPHATPLRAHPPSIPRPGTLSQPQLSRRAAAARARTAAGPEAQGVGGGRGGAVAAEAAAAPRALAKRLRRPRAESALPVCRRSARRGKQHDLVLPHPRLDRRGRACSAGIPARRGARQPSRTAPHRRSSPPSHRPPFEAIAKDASRREAGEGTSGRADTGGLN